MRAALNRPSLTQAALWSAVLLLALPVAWLAARNGLYIGARVPLDPNEGWNAAHTLRLMAGGPLYPASGALMVNNYPPLSFPLVALLTRVTGGDAIIAGRVLSLLSFFAATALIGAALAKMGCGWAARLFGALVFAAALLFASDYVAMDDPQLLGHAIQLSGLLLLLRGRPAGAVLAMTLGLFVKHNLIALPLASALWLSWQDRRQALRFILSGIAFALAGLLLFRFLHGTSLLTVLASPRLSSLANLKSVTGAFLAWAAIPALLLLIGLPRGRFPTFTLVYGAVALTAGIGFSAGDGVDANIFFDAAIALSLGLGLAAQQRAWTAPIAALALLVHLALTFSDNQFAYGPSLKEQSAADIAFLKAHPGPALCQQLSLCLWAGKPAGVDVFNTGEAIRTGARNPAPLLALIETRHFAVLQLDSLDALGPWARYAIVRAYRTDHTDDNGIFLTPRP